MDDFIEVLARLMATIDSRRGADPKGSYTAELLAAGPERQGKKLAEEALETAMAAAKGDKVAIAAESADLVYHWLVLLAGCGVSLGDVAERLRAREGTSGLDEKAGRPR